MAPTKDQLIAEGLESISSLLKHWDQEFFQGTHQAQRATPMASSLGLPLAVSRSALTRTEAESQESSRESETVPEDSIESQPTYQEDRHLTAKVHPSEPKWINYTRHKGLSLDPPRATYTTIFSQPTPTRPVPKATASITFTHEPGKPLSFVFETGKLSFTPDTISVMGSPLKRLKEIIRAKEDTAAYFAKYENLFHV